MRQVLALATALVVALGMLAGDPWKDKSYKEWDEKDVRKILSDSPWSKKIEIESGGRNAGLEAPEGAPTVAGGQGEGQEDEKEEKGRGGEEEEKRGTIFIVRWVSSRTVREAGVRSQVLNGRISPADIEKYLPPEPSDYQLALVGPDMSLFQEFDESALKGASYLTAKKSKRKMACSAVEILRPRDGKKISGIIFHFPKRTPPGEPLVSDGEKELRFISRAGAIEIKATFDLQKMIDPQGADF